MRTILITSLLAFAASACGASTKDSAEPPSMVEQGAALFASECAHCHGASGEGTDRGPAVVGDGVLPLDPPAGAERDVQFRTALDVFNWVKVAMPGDDPGSLSDEEYLAVMAFALTANGVKLDGPLDGEQAAAIVINQTP